MLVARKQQIDELKELFGDEYTDYNLVFCNSSGRPMEGQVITHALKKLIRENDLPDVVFHSFRHASITYKLKRRRCSKHSQASSNETITESNPQGLPFFNVGVENFTNRCYNI